MKEAIGSFCKDKVWAGYDSIDVKLLAVLEDLHPEKRIAQIINV